MTYLRGNVFSSVLVLNKLKTAYYDEQSVFSDSLSHLSGAFLPALSAANNHLFACASRNVEPDFLRPYYYSQFILFTN